MNVGISDSIYRDDGCRFAPRCLECHLPLCCYDLPPKAATTLLRERECDELLTRGLNTYEVASHMHISRRQVMRLKAHEMSRRLGIEEKP